MRTIEQPTHSAPVIPIRGYSAAAPRVIAVTSGKGGVGKTVIAANLGVCLAQLGRSVLLVDADLGLANLDLRLGVPVRHTIDEALDATCRIEDVIVGGPAGVSLLPACSGNADLTELTPRRRTALFDAVDAIEHDYDTLIVDTGSGIGSNAAAFAAAAEQVLVVVTPDPASVADAYAMIKVLGERGVGRIHLVVNLASGPAEADRVVSRLLDLVGKFLDVSVVPVGYLYRDDAVQQSVSRCRPLVCELPKAPVSASLFALAQRLLDDTPPDTAWGGPRLFWKRLMGLTPGRGVKQ